MTKRDHGNRKEFNWDAFDALMQFKVSRAFCADYLGVSEDTIERRIKEKADLTFREYNALKMQRTSVKLQQKAIEMALGGNATMMIFALKNISNWSDKSEISTAEGKQFKLSYSTDKKDAK